MICEKKFYSLRKGAFCDVEFVLVTYLSQLSPSEFPILAGIYHDMVPSPSPTSLSQNSLFRPMMGGLGLPW